MARPGLLRNRKFVRLARALDALAFGDTQVRGLGQSLAWGSLEMLWSVAYENGDDVLGTPDDVEALASWNGPAGVLFAALRDAGAPDRAGFIEEIPERPGVWRVHDLWDHAPDYVRKRRSRENQRKTKGAELSQAADGDRSVTGQRPPNGRTRAPAPAPAPTQETLSPAAPDLDPRELGMLHRMGVKVPAEEHPLTAQVIAEVRRRGWDAQWPKPDARGVVEAAIVAATVPTAVERLMAQPEDARRRKPWLGWWVDAIAGPAQRPRARSDGLGAPPPKCTTEPHPLEDLIREA